MYVLVEGGGAAFRCNYNDALHMIKKKKEIENSESPHGTGCMKMCRHKVNTESNKYISAKQTRTSISAFLWTHRQIH